MSKKKSDSLTAIKKRIQAAIDESCAQVQSLPKNIDLPRPMKHRCWFQAYSAGLRKALKIIEAGGK